MFDMISNIEAAMATEQAEDPFVPVDAARPWMVVPRQQNGPRGGSMSMFGRQSKPSAPSFRPLSMIDVGGLDEPARADYFAEFKKAAGPFAANRGDKLAGGFSIGGGTMLGGGDGGNSLQQQYQTQMAAFSAAPAVAGSFLPRAMQGQRAPNAPGAR